ncbi:MAG: C45 family autoproteolytic acyltransferase/hydrolase [Sumerlaeia bacterium]
MILPPKTPPYGADAANPSPHANHYERLIRVIREDKPGEVWAGMYREFEANYLRWFAKEGMGARPPYQLSRKRLVQTMPEFEALYDELVELAGGSDPTARLLSLYNPTPYLSGCSQLVSCFTGSPQLIRNYDYNPNWWEGVTLETNWLGTRVLGMSDCLWGLLDGINEHGLALSLTFGGRKVIGDGFGIPLVLRYVLQTCHSTAEAVAQLKRMPAHMAYNVTAVDASGEYSTIYLRPNDAPLVQRVPYATNHQEANNWTQYVQATHSFDRERELQLIKSAENSGLENPLLRFLQPPLFARKYRRGFGTLYTAAYSPKTRQVTYHWPGKSVELTLGSLQEQWFSMGYFEPSLRGLDASELVPHIPLY